MKKLIVSFGIVLSLGLSFAACGGEGGAASTTTVDTTAAAAPAPAPMDTTAAMPGDTTGGH